MTKVVEKLDERMRQWDATKVAQAERLVEDIIHWGDADALDLMRSREREQEVLDLIDDSQAG